MKQRRKRSAPTTTAQFDFEARREFLTGASKRKQQRRDEAQLRVLRRQKRERQLSRAERREKIREHINHVQTSQRLAKMAATVTPGRKRDSSTLKIERNESFPDDDADPTAKIMGSNAYPQPKARVPGLVSFHLTHGRSLGPRSVQPLYPDHAVQLVPETPQEPEDCHTASSPWLVGSCVCVSLGCFPDQQASAASPRSLQKPGMHDRNNVQPSQLACPAAVVTAKRKLKQLGSRRAMSQGRKPMKKRHKSRKPQKSRRGRK